MTASCSPDSSFVVDYEGVIRCRPWFEFVWQNHAFGSRHASLTPSVTLRQVHSATVQLADGLHDREAEGDALVTDQVGLSIGVRTADCVPILLLDPDSRAVGVVHAGWRGAAAQILRETVLMLTERFGTHPAQLQAAIGPCIRPCCYEVNEEVAVRFLPWLPHLKPDRPGKYHLDLAQANAAQLLEAGLTSGHIFDSGLCTSCNPAHYHSYRRESSDPGRMLSVIERTA